MPSRATVRDLLRRLVADAPGTSKTISKARRAKLEGKGSGSLFMWPPMAIAKKLKGKGRVNKALYEKWHKPILNVDERVGRTLEKEFGTKKLFRQVDVMPAGRKIKGHRALIQHERHSATAPISKTVKAVTPLAAVLYASDLMSKTSEDISTDLASSQDHLLKQAAAALDLADLREQACKLAFEMVEQGRIPPFQTYDQFQEKVAGLMTKDLEVVKEALELETVEADFGKVAEDQGTTGGTPEATFYHTLASEQ